MIVALFVRMGNIQQQRYTYPNQRINKLPIFRPSHTAPFAVLAFGRPAPYAARAGTGFKEFTCRSARALNAAGARLKPKMAHNGVITTILCKCV